MLGLTVGSTDVTDKSRLQPEFGAKAYRVIVANYANSI